MSDILTLSDIVTLEELAEYFKVDEMTLTRMVQRGDIRAFRVGRQYRFTREDVQAYIQSSWVVQQEEVKV